ncbi:MAG: FAD-dependent thymidylate synthase [Alphaproteobacteria bacterium 43-37]|nr:MAG: FAD-dependent thymidylate synthase [Alphaproteobacteria bacterium 43-37]
MTITQDQLLEIEQARAQSYQTRRLVAPGLEEMLYSIIPVLDHGFIRVIDYMGNDEAIVQAARVSYGKGTKKTTEDRGLINYLMRHRHTTPFEMCEIKYHVKLPIFIARQWIRHRTANVNEYSARYSILDNEFYVPNPENLATQSELNKQGRGDVLSQEQSLEILNLLKRDAENAYQGYTNMLNEDGEKDRPGLARELARMNITLNFYTQWYWKVDLHNLFHFLSLRADAHAQFEIQEYARAMLETTKAWVPHAYNAFMEYRVNGTHFSKTALEVIKRLIKGEQVTQTESGLTPREWREVMATLEQ